jgi:hypothetical protein
MAGAACGVVVTIWGAVYAGTTRNSWVCLRALLAAALVLETYSYMLIPTRGVLCVLNCV